MNETNEPEEMLPGEPQPVMPADGEEPRRTSRDVLYEQIGIQLVNAGVFTPAAEFVDQVRGAAGFRVSPREVAVAVAEVNNAQRPVNVDTVAEIVSASRGERSHRQQRHAELWRALGAQLILHGLDGSPEGQRRFLGDARRAAGPRASDVLLLRVALAFAESGAKLDAGKVGAVARRLALSATDLSPDRIPALVQQELRALSRQEAPRKRRPAALGRRAGASRTGSRAEWPINPGARKWRPGGRRRRKIRRP